MNVVIAPTIQEGQVQIVKKIRLLYQVLFFLKIYRIKGKYTAHPGVINGRWVFKINKKQNDLSGLLGLDDRYIFSSEIINASKSEVKLHCLRYYDVVVYRDFYGGLKYFFIETDKYFMSERFIEAYL